MGIEIPAGRYAVDPVHSTVGFATRFVAARVRGTFPAFTGEIEIAEDLTKSSVTAEVEVGSLTTGTAARDEHLRSVDYFDADRYPKAFLRSTGLEVDGERYLLASELTVHGVTRNVEFVLYFLGDGEDHYGNFRLGFRAHTRVPRSTFGVSGNAVLPGGLQLVGDATDLTLEISAIRQ
ncbi:YceI family protein [Pseudonocardia spinosispora]|uniref:YceI family protein n=1 Tax=Pseudonocardia spinosispora TaxID=103441 RepID=UPI0003FE013D|nr:YceI family protein [Pseudonocardia spinosispora]